ncbi:MAG: enoyl-CoA hydratase/isomerase family protein [Chloroflexota bacterium]
MPHKELVHYSEGDGVAVIRLNRPEKANALNRQMCQELNAAVARFLANDGMKVAVYCAAGRNFSAGVDVFDVKVAVEEDGMTKAASQFRIDFEERDFCEKPIIAAIQGQCCGAGFTTALACDLRIASEGAVFLLPEVKLGIASVHGNLRLVQLVGVTRALELLLTGDKRDANWAEKVGIVNEIVAADKVEARALEYAHKIAKMPAGAVLATRKVAFTSQFESFDDTVAAGVALRNLARVDEGYTNNFKARKS